jgi:hypothetical protein
VVPNKWQFRTAKVEVRTTAMRVEKVALQLSREIGVQFKTAWVLLMKLWEVVACERGGLHRPR